MATMAKAPAAMQAVIEKIPMRRMGRAEEAAAVAAWIASDDCSFTTGFTFDLSGGRAHHRRRSGESVRSFSDPCTALA